MKKPQILTCILALLVCAVTASGIDINGQLKKADLEGLASDPSSPSEGRIYLNTTTHKAKYRSNSAWLTILDTTSALFTVLTTTGDIIYSSDNSGTPARLAIGASGTVLHGGTTPSYSQIVNADVAAAAAIARSKVAAGTANHVVINDGSGNLSSEAQLAVSRGGTGLGSGTSGGVLGYTASGTLASSAALAANGVVYGGGAGATPAAATAGTADQVLVTPHAGGAPTMGQVDLAQSAAVKGSLPTARGGLGGDFSGASGFLEDSAGTVTTITDPLPIANGGTAHTTKSSAFDALSPMTTLGDLIYGGASGTGTRLAGDTTNARVFLRELSSAGTAAAPAWDSLVAGDIPSLAASKITSGQLASARGGTGADLSGATGAIFVSAGSFSSVAIDTTWTDYSGTISYTNLTSTTTAIARWIRISPKMIRVQIKVKGTVAGAVFKASLPANAEMATTMVVAGNVATEYPSGGSLFPLIVSSDLGNIQVANNGSALVGINSNTICNTGQNITIDALVPI